MQRLTIVRYRVKPEFVAENERLSHAVFERLRQDAPGGVTYSLFKEADGQGFVHLFVNLNEDSSDVLTETPEFHTFSADGAARWETPPEVARLRVGQVDSYFSPTPEV